MYFATNNLKHEVNHKNVDVISIYDGLLILVGESITHEHIYIDIEATGLDPYYAFVLLLSVTIGDSTVVFDVTNFKDPQVKELYFFLGSYVTKHLIVVGHNFKYDYKVLKVAGNFSFDKIYDTMIADQRIWQGFGRRKDNPKGFEFNFYAVCRRYDIQIPSFLSKDIRDEFVGANPAKFVVTNQTFFYAAGDTYYLKKLHEAQRPMINSRDLNFLIYGIEFPLVAVLAEMELEGFDLNEDAWLKLWKENKDKQYSIALELDKEIKRLRDDICPSTNRIHMVGGKWENPRINVEIQPMIGLFGYELDNKAAFGKKNVEGYNKNCFNFDSSDQIVQLFGILNEEMPTKDGNVAIPFINNKGIVVNKSESFTSGTKELQKFIIEYPNTNMKKFVELLIDYREYSTKISTFGKNFITNFKNKITGKYHTTYRQAVAVNGRLQSGGKRDNDNDKYNSQNIPAEKEFRNCFIADKGYSITTCDLSGAEIIVMASKGQDFRLLELMGQDIHSHMAQASWRYIYLWRAGRFHLYSDGISRKPLWNSVKDFWEIKDSPIVHSTFCGIDDLIEDSTPAQIKSLKQAQDLYQKYLTYEISKTVNADKRKSGKNNTFAAVYGVYASKAGKTINVSPEEGQIYIWTIEEEIPDTFAYINQVVDFGLTHGYMYLNKRTKSRVWYPLIIEANRHGDDIDYFSKSHIENQLRNITISGTQADILKEAMVEIHNAFVKQSIPAKILLQVHDELVVKQALEYDGVSDEFKANPKFIDFVPDLYDENDNFIEGSENKDIANLTPMSVPQFVAETMKKVANRYLKNVKMGAEFEVLPYWTK